MDKSKIIFNNAMPKSVYKKAVKTKEKFVKKFGDDSNVKYTLTQSTNKVLSNLNVVNLDVTTNTQLSFPSNAVIIGNIRMGFGHYRISIAMASAAYSLGYQPFWFDLCSFSDTTCGKVIKAQNDLYSMGSRWSQKYPIFNKLFWEPLNSEGFRQISYNSADQKTAELFAPVYNGLPKDIPFIATHVWPAQGAIHAGLTNAVNAIPDNWPMALHLSEGSIHTVQTPSAFLGYKMLRGMDKDNKLNPMPKGSIYYTGHYVDHEIVSNIESDCNARINRVKTKQPIRYLLTVGGAGAQQELFIGIVKKLIPYIEKNQATLFINVGDHKNVWENMVRKIPYLATNTVEHFDEFEKVRDFADKILTQEVNGVHAFYDQDIFAAVYSTNLLMRASDVLVTKPSELAFYPVPKLLIKRVGGHEAYGAFRSQEVGDGTFECDTLNSIESMIDLAQNDEEVIISMCKNIIVGNNSGIYNGAYEVVKLATKGKS